MFQIRLGGNQSPKFLWKEAHPWARGGGVNHLVETWQLYLQLCMEESGVQSAGMWQIIHYAVTSEMALLSWRLGHLRRPLSLSIDLIISYAKPS